MISQEAEIKTDCWYSSMCASRPTRIFLPKDPLAKLWSFPLWLPQPLRPPTPLANKSVLSRATAVLKLLLFFAVRCRPQAHLPLPHNRQLKDFGLSFLCRGFGDSYFCDLGCCHVANGFSTRLSQVLGRQWLRGPRPPAVQWPHSRRNVSAVDHQVPAAKKGKGKGSGQAKGWQRFPSRRHATMQRDSLAAPKQRVPMSPDQVVEAARYRVAKLKQVLATLGEEDDMYAAVQEALLKAEYQAREQPVCERIRSTKSFVERKQKRVEQAQEATERAREALNSAMASRRGRTEARSVDDGGEGYSVSIPSLSIT